MDQTGLSSLHTVGRLLFFSMTEQQSGPNGTGVDPRCHATVEEPAPFTPKSERGCFHKGAFCNLHKKLEMWMQKKETPSDKRK